MQSDSEKAIEIIKNGGVIIFPTDTAFGIGCRADDADAVKRLFEIRHRPEDKATPVLVSGIEMAEEFVDKIPDDVRDLMNQNWPGGLTVILPSHDERIVPMVKGGTDTLGVRMPDHEVPLALVSSLGVPLLAPSANFAGEQTPFRYEDIDPELIKLVDYVIPGKTKGTQLASTVVDCTVKPWKILRQGSVGISV